MEFSIENLSSQENELTKRAKQDYGKIFDNAHASVSLLWEFIDSVDKERTYMFMLFLSQVRKSVTLAMLSAIRRHEVQIYMMLRQALESACRAVYGLHFQNQEEFKKIIKHNTFEQVNDKIKNKCYPFIDTHYPHHSKIIKDWKDEINNMFSHANMTTAHSTFEYLDDKIGNSFFDKEDDFFIKSSLWQIANISLGFLKFFYDAVTNVPLIVFCDNFTNKAKALLSENDNIREKMKKHPRVRKWVQT